MAKLKLPSAAVTVLATGEPGTGGVGGGTQLEKLERLIVTPPSPDSPGSRVPLPLVSTNFVPEIVPVRIPLKLPKSLLLSVAPPVICMGFGTG